MSALRNPVSISANSAHHSPLLSPPSWPGECNTLQPFTKPHCDGHSCWDDQFCPSSLSPKASHASLCSLCNTFATVGHWNLVIPWSLAIGHWSFAPPRHPRNTAAPLPSAQYSVLPIKPTKSTTNPTQNRTGDTENDNSPHARTHSF